MGKIKIADSSVDVPGGSIFVRTWNPGKISDKIPVILLHDSLGCIGMWRKFPELLAQGLGRPIVAYDRLGFGRSSERYGLPGINFIREEAEIYFPLIRSALGLSEYVLFGHSVGGAMAVFIAALFPNQCKAVITESAQAFVEDRTLAGIRQAQKQFEDSGQFERLGKWHGHKSQWVLNAWTEVWLSPDFTDWSLEPLIRQVKSPVLAIHGDQDEYGSMAFPEFICQRVAGAAQLFVLAGCGHVPHHERPVEVIDRVSLFLE